MGRSVDVRPHEASVVGTDDPEKKLPACTVTRLSEPVDVPPEQRLVQRALGHGEVLVLGRDGGSLHDASGGLVRAWRFEPRFPGWDPSLSALGNQLRTAVSGTGDVFFVADETLARFRTDADALDALGELPMAPERIAASERGELVATVSLGLRAWVFRVADGFVSGPYRWTSPYPGGPDELRFHADDSELVVTTSYTTPLGDDAWDLHAWTIDLPFRPPRPRVDARRRGRAVRARRAASR